MISYVKYLFQAQIFQSQNQIKLMQKQNLIAILILVAIGTVFFNAQKDISSIQAQYSAWKAQYNKMGDLSAEEDAYRLKIFEQNLHQIELHNSNQENTYKMGVNQFSAYTQNEFETIYLSNFVSQQKQARNDGTLESLKVQIDWVSKGAVRPVRNQGSCIGTYAFSAIGAIEGNAFVYHQISREYSVQQLIDCSTTYGNQGCNTGYMTNCFEYIKAKGISAEEEYPYRGNYGSCRHDYGSFKISGYTNIISCSQMETALNERPLSVAVDGTYFRNYHSGVFSNCGTRPNLAALLVGMTDNYYRLKNSWGVNWGEAGYIRLARGFNVCAICTAVSYPTPAN